MANVKWCTNGSTVYSVDFIRIVMFPESGTVIDKVVCQFSVHWLELQNQIH